MFVPDQPSTLSSQTVHEFSCIKVFFSLWLFFSLLFKNVNPGQQDDDSGSQGDCCHTRLPELNYQAPTVERELLPSWKLVSELYIRVHIYR